MTPGFEQIIGSSPALEAVLAQVERVAPTDATVLIHGAGAGAARVRLSTDGWLLNLPD
jgi:transcriptional regulator with GAF, ATPase, and Fis domain